MASTVREECPPPSKDSVCGFIALDVVVIIVINPEYELEIMFC